MVETQRNKCGRIILNSLLTFVQSGVIFTSYAEHFKFWFQVFWCYLWHCCTFLSRRGKQDRKVTAQFEVMDKWLAVAWIASHSTAPTFGNWHFDIDTNLNLTLRATTIGIFGQQWRKHVSFYRENTSLCFLPFRLFSFWSWRVKGRNWAHYRHLMFRSA